MRPSLVALAFGLLPLASHAEELAHVGTYFWDTELIVGLSGLEVSPDGNSFTAIGDRGYWLTGTIDRLGEIISGINIEALKPILGDNGYPVAARRVGDWSDAEGLAIAPDGTVWVSFERWAHVARYPEGLDGSAVWTKDHPTFYDHADNWQLEAVALAPDGSLYAFSERPLQSGFPIYRLIGNAWTIDGYLPERDLFAIVGADFDENGDLYILERKLIVGIWWQSRIRRVRLDGTEDTTLWTSERGSFDNLEGIAVWRDDEGLRLTLVSDNNAILGKPAEFVEFRLTE